MKYIFILNQKYIMDIKSVITQNVITNWKEVLLKIVTQNKNYTNKLNEFLDKEKETFEGFAGIFPPQNLIFNAFNFFSIEDLKVVIIGQDPYHQKGQAMGLSFSVPKTVRIPPSLRNIIKEIKNEFEIYNNIELSSLNGDLTHLANQGVLLLNTTLTVRESAPNKHKKPWNYFTYNVIKHIVSNCENVVFLLWGNESKEIKYNLLKDNVDISNNHFLESCHPSPLSANKGNWFGNNHFKKCNEILDQNCKDPIKWLNI